MLHRNDIRPSTQQEEFVLDFFADMGPDLNAFKANYEKRLAENAVWETVGRPPCVGKRACLDYLDALHERTGMEYCEITLHAIASRGDTVLTEREDAMYRADGSLFMSFRIAGAVVVQNGLIVRYTDYCDLSPLKG